MKNTKKTRLLLVVTGLLALAGTAVAATYENMKATGAYSYGPVSSVGACHKVSVNGTNNTSCEPVSAALACSQSRTWTRNCVAATGSTCVGSGTQTDAGSCTAVNSGANCGPCHFSAFPSL
jgi:hypothetical protein